MRRGEGDPYGSTGNTGQGRVIAIILLVIFLAIGFVFFDPLGSKNPEGVDTDAFELRSVTMSGDDYEVVTYDDDLFVLSADNVEVLGLEDSCRDFMSRDERTLWLKPDTVERLGLAGEIDMVS